MSVTSKQVNTKPSPRYTVTFGQVGKVARRSATDEVRPRSGRAAKAIIGEAEFCAARRKVRSRLCQQILSLRIRPRLRHGRTSSGTSCHLPLEGKALLRIKILCQHNMSRSNFCRHNMGSVKLHSDHQNAISRQCPPQARQSLPAGAKSNSDHQNSDFAATPAVGAVTAAPQGVTIRIRISREHSP